ncbi:hypothetical protein [Clostridium akagii]|uniref:hypothetical protein n=1 Tax=Clostridium akagii TaxID=91623 RepID=UPI00047D4874|nr:hypothetical protein [Clostridium akagii]
MRKFIKIFNRIVLVIISLVSLYCYIKAYNYEGYLNIRNDFISMSATIITIYMTSLVVVIGFDKMCSDNKASYNQIFLRSAVLAINIPQILLISFDWKYKLIYSIFLDFVGAIYFMYIAFLIYEKRIEICDFFRWFKSKIIKNKNLNIEAMNKKNSK